jgi:hypothetical protein
MAMERGNYEIASAQGIRHHIYQQNRIPAESAPVFREHYRDLSGFGNYMVHLADDLLYEFQVDPDHILPVTILIATAYDAYRFDLDYHLMTLLFCTEGSTGKSFMVENVLMRFLIGDSVRRITRRSECYNSVQRIGTEDDEIQYYDELPKGDVRNEDGMRIAFIGFRVRIHIHGILIYCIHTGMGDPRWKERTSCQRNIAIVLNLRDNVDREQLQLISQNICSQILCTNFPICKLENAVQSRLLMVSVNRHVHMSALHRQTRARAAVEIPPHIQNMHRQIHYTQIHINKMIQTGAMDSICMIVNDILAPMLRDRFINGQQMNLGSRDWNKISLIARTHCIEEIWIRHFGNPGGAFFGQDVTPERLRFLDQQLYVTTEHWVMALGQVAPYLFGDTQHRIRQAIYNLWKNGSVSHPTRWRVITTKDPMESMYDGRGVSTRPSTANRLAPPPDPDLGSGSLALFGLDYNYVMFVTRTAAHENTMLDCFAAVIQTEMVRDTHCMIPPPTTKEIASVLRGWRNTTHIGRPVVSTMAYGTPVCRPISLDEDVGYTFSDSESNPDMTCIVDIRQGIGFATSFLKPDVSASKCVREFVQDILRKNHGACIRTMRDAGLDSRFVAEYGGFYTRNVLYGNPPSDRPHLFDHVELRETDARLPGFQIQYDILKMHVAESKLKKIFGRDDLRNGEILEWPYSLEHLAILSRQKSIGILDPPCSGQEFLRVMRTCLFENPSQSGIANMYMNAYFPTIADPAIRASIAASDYRIWDCAPWPSIMAWSLFLNTPAKDLMDSDVWMHGIKGDVDFRIEAVQSAYVDWLCPLWKHPVLSIREWFHSPEAQHLIFHRALHLESEDTPLKKFYRETSKGKTYKERMESHETSPAFILIPPDVAPTESSSSSSRLFSDTESESASDLDSMSESESQMESTSPRKRRRIVIESDEWNGFIGTRATLMT